MIVHHDVNNEARDSQLLYPMAVATKGVLKVDHIQVVTEVATPTRRKSLGANRMP